MVRARKVVILLLLLHALQACGVWCLPTPMGQMAQAQAGLSMKFIQKQTRRDEAPLVYPKAPHLRPPWTADETKSAAGSKVMDPNSSKIIFPDAIPTVVKQSKCSETICIKAHDYPSDYVNRLLRRTRIEFRSLFEEIPFNGPLTNRLDPSDGEPLCQSKEEVITPQKALNKDSQWMFVLQDTKTGQFIQSVRIETCLPRIGVGDEESSTCQYTQSFPLGYRTSCKQKYIYKKLLAIPANDTRAEPVLENFQIPSCCSCTVKVEH